MRYLIMLEETETGFAVQVPDLAVSTHGETIEAARAAAVTAIQINLETYREAGMDIPESQSVLTHLENPAFKELLFSYVNIPETDEKAA